MREPSRLMPRLLSPPDLDGPILVVAPHCDDETLGCGGVLVGTQGHCRRHVVFLAEPDPGRRREWEAAERIVAPDAVGWCGLPDRPAEPPDIGRAVALVTDILGRERPRTVFVPNRSDPHPLHKAAHAVLAAAAARSAWAGNVLECDGLVALETPNLWVRIDAHAAAKEAALRCYEGQDLRLRLADVAAAINNYRALTFPLGRSVHVEAFRATPAGATGEGAA